MLTKIIVLVELDAEINRQNDHREQSLKQNHNRQTSRNTMQTVKAAASH